MDLFIKYNHSNIQDRQIDTLIGLSKGLLTDPLPPITFPENAFLFTGTCAFGTRKQCQDVITTLGGIVADSVNKKLNYLVIGSYVTDSWAHESFGRKIEKAMEYRDTGIPLVIVSEEYWLSETGV